ncbi:efflux RND transporter periplasmic adaptor subunit [Hymenobacter caeli]|uniref:Cobalt-zinc-cadmium efflux system membrane fusion protein n=1 Tax=Hymenobacter caeli TaxID=2735894 RepID=A0ABX2FW71_9BACT|nr:efflux RND transporter periplasmic adaptor subunit [Hymenobacter caeli]NRT21475.1 cobalt-zinc-cadmium efflux system membrane fusion protein [Hymenobacter caeli]
MPFVLKTYALAATLALLTACGSKPGDTTKKDDPGNKNGPPGAPAAPANPDQISVSPAQEKAAGITLGTFERQNMTTEVQANGSVEVPPENRVSITAIMGGYVQTVLVLPGQHVAAGAVVATLRAPEYLTLQETYLQSKAKVRFLAEDLERQRVLDVEDVGAKRKLQLARADYAAEQATLRATAAQLRLLGLSVARLDATGQIAGSVPLRSTLSGYVRVVNINPGQYVGPQDVLVEVLNRDDLHLELKVFEKDVAQVKPGQKILFKVQNAGRDEELTARVFLVGKAFDSDARTVRVHAHLEPGRQDLLPGQFVAARIQTAGARVRTLPEGALIQAGELSYIFRAVGQDSGRTVFRRVKVKTGPPQHGDMAVTVLDPLPDTTRLVRQGAYFLDAELRKGEGGD